MTTELLQSLAGIALTICIVKSVLDSYLLSLKAKKEQEAYQMFNSIKDAMTHLEHEVQTDGEQTENEQQTNE
ncbi:MAG: hypothetical protein IKK40_02725 [Bacteroidales bacterium]|nr:hypothetical protein [Bacteroidales bacterium]MBR6265822.1 hypothetical protein [Bacteroidales bacterium]